MTVYPNTYGCVDFLVSYRAACSWFDFVKPRRRQACSVHIISAEGCIFHIAHPGKSVHSMC